MLMRHIILLTLNLLCIEKSKNIYELASTFSFFHKKHTLRNEFISKINIVINDDLTK